MSETLERRKGALNSFYEKHDPGRTKNVDPIFKHFNFDDIFQAVKKKYGILPLNWEYEPYFDKAGVVPDQALFKEMREAGLDPTVVLPHSIPEKENKQGIMSTLSRRGLKKKESKQNVKEQNVTLRKRVSDLEELDVSQVDDSDSIKRFAPHPPTGPPPNRKMSKQKSDSKTNIGRGKKTGNPKKMSSNTESSPATPEVRRQRSNKPLIRKESRQEVVQKEAAEDTDDDAFLPPPPSPEINVGETPRSLLPRGTNVSNDSSISYPQKSNTKVSIIPPPPPYDMAGSPLLAEDSPAPLRDSRALESKVPPTMNSRVSSSISKSQDVSFTVEPRQTQLKNINVPVSAAKPVPPPPTLPVVTITPPPVNIIPENSSAGDDVPAEEVLAKYKRMLKSGLPQGAVLNCMTRDGVDVKYFNLLQESVPAKELPVNAVAKPKQEATKQLMPPIKQSTVAAIVAPAGKVVQKSNSVPQIKEPATLPNKSSDSNVKKSVATSVAVKKQEPKAVAATDTGKAKNLNPKFAQMHALINKSMGMETAKPALKESRSETAGGAKPQVSSKFANMHGLLDKQFGGGGAGGKDASKSAKTATSSLDAAKAESVATKIAEIGKSQNLQVLPPDAPEYEKYRKMQKTGLPEGAIRNCMIRDGFDPEGFYNPKVPASSSTNVNVLSAGAQQGGNAIKTTTPAETNITNLYGASGSRAQQQTPFNGNGISYPNNSNMNANQNVLNGNQGNMNTNQNIMNSNQSNMNSNQNFMNANMGDNTGNMNMMNQNMQGYNNMNTMQQQQGTINGTMNINSLYGMNSGGNGVYNNNNLPQQQMQNYYPSNPQMVAQGNINGMNGMGYYNSLNTSSMPAMVVNGGGMQPMNAMNGVSQQSMYQAGYGQYGGPAQVQSVQYTVNPPRVQRQVWSVEWSDEYQRPYYFNKFTGQSSWTVPAEMQ